LTGGALRSIASDPPAPWSERTSPDERVARRARGAGCRRTRQRTGEGLSCSSPGCCRSSRPGTRRAHSARECQALRNGQASMWQPLAASSVTRPSTGREPRLLSRGDRRYRVRSLGPNSDGSVPSTAWVLGRGYRADRRPGGASEIGHSVTPWRVPVEDRTTPAFDSRRAEQGSRCGAIDAEPWLAAGRDVADRSSCCRRRTDSWLGGPPTAPRSSVAWGLLVSRGAGVFSSRRNRR
jgi:hypothetical protein